MENSYNEENTYKQFYYASLSDEGSNDLTIDRESPKLKRKREPSIQNLDDFFEVSTNKKKKLSSSVSRAQPEGGIAYIATNTDDIEMICEDIEMYELCQEIEKNQIFDSTYDEELYNLCAAVEENISHPSSTQSGRGSFKRNIETNNNNGAKKSKQHELKATTSAFNLDDHKVKCSVCKILVNQRYLASHLKSNIHKNNVLKLHDTLSNVSVIESAFGQRIVTYKINSKPTSQETVFETPELFLNSIKDDILLLIEKEIQQHTVFKVNFILHADFIQQTKDISNSFDFQTCNFIIFQGDDFNIFFSSLCDTLTNKISSFEKQDSGWSLKQIKCIDMNINKFNPLRGSSYIDLPEDIKTKKAVINVKNSDYQCFKWALLSALYPAKKNSDRVTSYSKHSNKLKFDGVSFPVKLTDIAKVEKLNNISINVFGLEYNDVSKKHSVVGPLYFTKSRKSNHINLLYLHNGSINHYCYIKNLSRLVSKQISNQEHAVHICDGCLLHFPTADRLKYCA